MKRTNVLLTDEQHRAVKAYAKKKGKTLGRMVREALEATYGEKDALLRRKDAAVAAYREGLISLGKVADVLGLDPVSARAYLQESGLTVEGPSKDEIRDDADHA